MSKAKTAAVATATALAMFVPVTKVDTVKRLVYGTMAGEATDHAKEIFDYATSKPLFEKWSSDIQKATDGKSLGNVRAMHGAVAAGKLTDIVFNDDAKQIECCAKVVDDQEWNKVLEGLYTGFSIGGKYAKRWKDEAKPELMRYTAEPYEVSLVDLPCNPEATFSMVKADGTTELCKFKVAPVEENTEGETEGEKTGEVAKVDAVDGEKTGDWHPGVEQVWKAASDGKTFKTKAEAIAHDGEAAAKAAADAAAKPALDAIKQITDALGKIDGKNETENTEAAKVAPATPEVVAAEPIGELKSVEDVAKAVKVYDASKEKTLAKRVIVRSARTLKALDAIPADWNVPAEVGKVSVADMRKSFSFIQYLVGLLSQINDAEESYEYCVDARAGGSDLANRFGAMLVEFGDLVAEMLDSELAMVRAEEAAEASAAVTRSTKLFDLVKVGARHGKSDQERVNSIHDMTVELGASNCSTAKSVDGGDLTKITAERDALTKAMDTLKPVLEDLAKRVLAIEAQPVTTPARSLHVVSKGADQNDEVDKLAKRLEDLPPEQANEHLAKLAIKVAQRNPRSLGG